MTVIDQRVRVVTLNVVDPSPIRSLVVDRSDSIIAFPTVKNDDEPLLKNQVHRRELPGCRGLMLPVL